MDNKKIGLFISTLRKEKNMTQKELADKLYVSDKAISKWERGLSLPDIGIIEKLSDYLGVNVSEILKGERIERMTKKNSDEIVKESIPFFQKRYFRNRITRIITIFILFFFAGYFSLLCIGEANYGRVGWKLFGTEYSMDLPSFSAKRDIKNIERFLEALKNYDYNEIDKILKQNPNGTISGTNVDFNDYIANLEELKKEGFEITNYKYVYSYYRNQGYSCAFDIIFNYKNTKFSMTPQIQGYGKGIIVGGLGWRSKDVFNVNNNISIIEITDAKLFDRLEKIFEY